MTIQATTTVSTPRAPEMVGPIVVVIGGSAGMGLETARRARAEGADVVLAARNPERLEQAALELGAQSTATFDANDPASLERFFEDLSTPIDHVMVTGGAPTTNPHSRWTPKKRVLPSAVTCCSSSRSLATPAAESDPGRFPSRWRHRCGRLRMLPPECEPDPLQARRLAVPLLEALRVRRLPLLCMCFSFVCASHLYFIP